MTTSSFFNIHTRNIESKEIRHSQQQGAVRSAKLPWCAHKHSPARFEVVTMVLSRTNVLQCAGVLENCPLSQQQLADV
jgi:hypothetical protein